MKFITLGEVCDIIAGQSPPSIFYNQNGRGLPFFQGKADFNSLYPTVRYWCEKPQKIALPNDILLSVRAPVGPTNLCDRESCIGRGLSAIRAGKNVNYKYLLYFFRSIENKLSNQGRGSTFSAITQSEIKEILFPLLDLSTQKKIAHNLEQIDLARQKRKQANQLTEQYVQSIFLEWFGDPETNPYNWKIGSINDVLEYSEYGTSNKSNKDKIGYPVLGMANITYSGQLDLTKYSYVELNDREYEKLKLKNGDIIFNRTNSTELVGKTTYWNKEMDAVIASYLVKLKLNKNFDPICFTFLLNTVHFKKLFMKRCKKAVNQSNISPTLLKEFPVYIPPLPLQRKFAKLVERVEQLRAKQRQSEKELDNLFNSLMGKYFG